MIVVPDATVVFKSVLEREDEPGHPQAVKLQAALLAEQVKIQVPTLGATRSAPSWG